MALFYCVHRRYSEAEPLYLRSLEINEKALGTNHPNVAATFYNIGLLFYETDRKEKAVCYLKRALKIVGDILPADHPNIIKTLKSLSDMCFEIGEPEEAAEYARRAEELQKSREYREEEPPE